MPKDWNDDDDDEVLGDFDDDDEDDDAVADVDEDGDDDDDEDIVASDDEDEDDEDIDIDAIDLEEDIIVEESLEAEAISSRKKKSKEEEKVIDEYTPIDWDDEEDGVSFTSSKTTLMIRTICVKRSWSHRTLRIPGSALLMKHSMHWNL